MDCGAEEQMVRMGLADLDGIADISTDTSTRTVVVIHDTDTELVDAAIDVLGLRSHRTSDEPANASAVPDNSRNERIALIIALTLNAVMMFGEAIAGWLANSLGLLADALDMGADAIVYALSLFAVGQSAVRKAGLARTSGYLQLALAVIGLAEVGRRFISDEPLPNATTMVAVSLVALGANTATMIALRRARNGEIHIEASWIFTANDIKINGLVIATAFIVTATNSRYPDLIVGAIIFAIAANGARRILNLAPRQLAGQPTATPRS